MEKCVLEYEQLTKDNFNATFLPPSKDLTSHPGYFSFLTNFLKRIINTKMDALEELIKKIEEYSKKNEIKCEKLSIEFWEEYFDDIKLKKVIKAISQNYTIEYIGFRENNITNEGIKYILEELRNNKNKGLLYIEVDEKLKETDDYKEIQEILRERFLKGKLNNFLNSYNDIEEKFDKDNPILIDKLNDLSYLYYSLGTKNIKNKE
jgi:hypothetical protein